MFAQYSIAKKKKISSYNQKYMSNLNNPQRDDKPEKICQSINSSGDKQ